MERKWFLTFNVSMNDKEWKIQLKIRSTCVLHGDVMLVANSLDTNEIQRANAKIPNAGQEILIIIGVWQPLMMDEF